MTRSNEAYDVAAFAERALPTRAVDEPMFRLAWHARVFSLIVALVKSGHIPWTAFQERLVRHINQTESLKACQSAEEIDLHYFDCWLEAAHETLVVEGFITDSDVADRVERIHDSVVSIRHEQLAKRSGQEPIAVDTLVEPLDAR